MHVHLDHENCMESVILRGATSSVVKLAESLMAQTGVRHDKLNLVPTEREFGHFNLIGICIFIRRPERIPMLGSLALEICPHRHPERARLDRMKVNIVDALRRLPGQP